MGPEILVAGAATEASGLGAVGTAAGIGGGLLKAFGSIFGGEAASGKMKYQAGISRMNSMINKQNADMERTIGEREAARSGMKTALTMGKTETAQAAQGGVVDSGTNADVLDSEHALGSLDQATIRNTAARRAYGFDVKSAEDESSAKMFDKGATNAKTASYLEAGGSLLSTAGSVATKWLDAKKHGLYSEEGNPKAMSGTSYKWDEFVGDDS